MFSKVFNTPKTVLMFYLMTTSLTFLSMSNLIMSNQSSSSSIRFLGENVENELTYFEVVDPILDIDLFNENPLHYYPGITYNQKNTQVPLQDFKTKKDFLLLEDNEYVQIKNIVDDFGNIILAGFYLTKQTDGNGVISFTDSAKNSFANGMSLAKIPTSDTNDNLYYQYSLIDTLLGADMKDEFNYITILFRYRQYNSSTSS